MRPQDLSKSFHQTFHLFTAHVFLARATISKVLLKLLKSSMNLPVLAQQFKLFPELGHLLCQHGENMLFLNRVVEIQLQAELQPHHDHLTSRQTTGSLSSTVTSLPELVPC